MIVLPSGACVWLACGYTDMRKGMDGLAMLAQQVLAEDPFSGALFAFRGKRGGSGKTALVRWAGSVPVQQTAGEGPLPMAGHRHRACLPDARSTVDVARSSMLIPLLVRLTDSEIDEVDRVVAQASNGVEDSRGVLEEVGPAGLLIHQKSLLPDLNIEPIHGDVQSGGQLGRAE